jgi:rRNA-processing protein FCF1
MVVDTGALLTALVLNFVRMIQVPGHKQQEILNKAIAPYLRQSQSLRDAYLSRFSRDIRPLRTTPHVIAEIHGLAKAKSKLNLHSQDLSSFWRYSIDFLLANRLDEVLVRLIELRDLSEVICEIGPIDTAIIQLAHKEGAVLLTTDTRLLGRAREQGVDVLSDYDFVFGQ